MKFTSIADASDQSHRMALTEILLENACACSRSWRIQQSGKLLEYEWLRLKHCHMYSYAVLEPDCVEMKTEVPIAPAAPSSADADEVDDGGTGTGTRTESETETF